MIETMEMEMEDETDKVMETILPMPAETIEAPIEVPTSPVNEECDNEEYSFET